MSLIVFFLVFTPLSAIASTWLEMGDELPMTEELWSAFQSAELCKTDGGYPDTFAIYQGEIDGQIIVFQVFTDGRTVALVNAYGERASLDYCQ